MHYETPNVSNSSDSNNCKTSLKSSVDATASIILCNPRVRKHPWYGPPHKVSCFRWNYTCQNLCVVFACVSVYAIDNKSYLMPSPILRNTIWKVECLQQHRQITGMLLFNRYWSWNRIATHQERYIYLRAAIVLAISNLPNYADVA